MRKYEYEHECQYEYEYEYEYECARCRHAPGPARPRQRVASRPTACDAGSRRSQRSPPVHGHGVANPRGHRGSLWRRLRLCAVIAAHAVWMTSSRRGARVVA